jgi:HAE1 family hydrophobic/amphiphilic exporter-1
VGGLLFSQLVTLYLTPVFYIYMSSLQERVRSRKQGKPGGERVAAVKTANVRRS